MTAQTSEGFQVVVGVSEADRFEGAESLTGRLPETDSSLLDRSSSKLVNVIVKLDYDPLAVYDGSIEGSSATSPSVTGRPLDRGSARDPPVHPLRGGLRGGRDERDRVARPAGADRAVVPARVRGCLRAVAGERG